MFLARLGKKAVEFLRHADLDACFSPDWCMQPSSSYFMQISAEEPPQTPRQALQQAADEKRTQAGIYPGAAKTQEMPMPEAASKARALHVPQAPLRIAFALVMGVVGALVAAALVLACNAADNLWQHWPWMVAALPLLGAASIWLYRRLGLKVSAGAPDVLRDVRDDQPVDLALAPAAFLGTVASVAGGASVGKTSIAMQIGASLGSFAGRVFGLKAAGADEDGERLRGYAAQVGMAASVAALLLTPLGALAMVIEMSKRATLTVRHIPTTLVACFAAFFISKALGVVVVLPEIPVLTLSWEVAAHSALIGAACAVGGMLYAMLVGGARTVVLARIKNPYIAVVIGGICVAVLTAGLGWWHYAGTGTHLLHDAFNGTTEDLGFLIKAMLTAVALGFGFRGGEITPLLICGALMGSTLARFVGAYVPLMAAVGMLAFLASAARVPVAAILMGCDLFGWEGLPLYALAVVIAYGGSRGAGLWSQDLPGEAHALGLHIRRALTYAKVRVMTVLGKPEHAPSLPVPAERVAAALASNPTLSKDVSEAVQADPKIAALILELAKDDPHFLSALEKSLDTHPELEAQFYQLLDQSGSLKKEALLAYQQSLHDHVRANQ